MKYISGAKCEEHHSNIPRDILNPVLHCFSATIYDGFAFSHYF